MHMTPIDPSSSLKHNQATGTLLVLSASLFWGSSGIFIIKIISISSWSAISLAFWRDLVSSLVILLGILIIDPKLLRVKKADWPWLIIMGVISIGIFHICWNIAVVRLGASLATVIQCNATVIVSILAWVIFKERLTSRKILAIAASIGGTILAAGMVGAWDLEVDPVGIWIGLGSAVTYGSLSLIGKKLSGDYSSWTITFYIFTIGALTIFLFQGGQPDPWPVGTGILPWLLAFVLMSTMLGFGVYTKALSMLPASVAAILSTAEILFAAVLAAIFLGERLGIWQILGAALIILGVVLVSWNKSKSKIR